MKENLARALKFLKTKPELAEYEIRHVEGELHLSKGSDCFVRLTPDQKGGAWSMVHFHNREHWESIDFAGSLEECLDFLSDNTHYLFWEG